MSLDHPVTSIDVPAPRTSPLTSQVDKDDPTTVTLVDPVCAPFDLVTVLPIPESIETSPPDVPVSIKAVVIPTPRLDPGDPCPTRPCTTLSDVHTVPSSPLKPTRPPTVPTRSGSTPTLLPKIVTLTLPVDPPFDAFAELPNAVSKLQDLLTLLRSGTVSVVIVTSPLPVPQDTRPRTLLPDTHVVVPAPLPPPRTPALYSPISPSPEPITVTLADPVRPKFVLPTLLVLIDAKSIVKLDSRLVSDPDVVTANADASCNDPDPAFDTT